MNLSVSIPIYGSKEKIWSIITDIEHSYKYITAINKIEVIEKPDNQLKGLKWRETRTMFKKEATEVMWITEAEENIFYKTRAESHGMIYESTLTIEDEKDHKILTMSFDGQPQKITGKLMNIIFGNLMKSSMEKSILKDLIDIKNTVEQLR